ncbi:MAG: acetolactate synthase large subunit, partial [Gammaproteobacteria bacterium]
AATYGRLTGNPGVCLSTLGPGASNLVTAAAYAQLGGMPMLMITGQKPVKKSKQGQFQIIDVVNMMRPVTKFTRQLVNSHHIASTVREAFRLAQEECPGAVHIELPEDIAAELVEDRVFDVVGYCRPDADQSAIEKAADMIGQARYPLLLIGAAANRRRTRLALTDFVDKTGLPFFNTQLGKGVVDERHPQFLGTAALSDNDFIHCAIRRADLIVNVGHDVVEKPPFFMTQGGTQVIHVNYFAARVDEVYFPQLNIVGDIATSVQRLQQAVRPSRRWELSYFQRVKAEVELHLGKYALDNRFPILPQRLVTLLRQALNDEDIVTLDNGVYKIWFARNYPCYQPNTLLLDNSLATMGAGLPSAMVAKLLHPDRKVVSVNGDGGFMMNSQEIETAVRLGLDLIIIILNDSAYGMIRWKQEGLGFEDFGLQYGNPNFVQYAESFGAQGHRPTSCEDLQRILDHCLNSHGVHLVDLPVDYSLNHPILNVLLKEKTCIL